MAVMIAAALVVVALPACRGDQQVEAWCAQLERVFVAVREFVELSPDDVGYDEAVEAAERERERLRRLDAPSEIAVIYPLSGASELQIGTAQVQAETDQFLAYVNAECDIDEALMQVIRDL